MTSIDDGTFMRLGRNTLCFVAAALAITSSPVQMETVDCTAVTLLPYPITAPGVYCLTGHLKIALTSGRAIEIKSDDVVLDLNGFTLESTKSGPNTRSTGIFAYEQRNITVRNGTVRGFFYGVHLGSRATYDQPTNYLVENIRAEQNTLMGVHLKGLDVVARSNIVVATGGSDAKKPWDPPSGIFAEGPSSRLIDNDVSGVVGDEAAGIRIHAGHHTFVERNRVDTIRPDQADQPTYGIILDHHGENAVVVGNSVSEALHGLFFANRSTGKYMNNMTVGVGTPYQGGTPAGSTNY